MCCNMQPFLKVIEVLINIIMISIPIILIVLGTIDMFKAITANDEKQIKEARGSLIKRVIYAVLIFLVPFIVRLILQFTEEMFLNGDNSGLENPTSWVSCWNSTMDGTLNCSSCQDIYEEDETGSGNNQNQGNTGNPNQGNTGSTGSQNGTKMCYWWKMAVCDKSLVLDNLGVAEETFYTVYSNVIFENDKAVCKLTNSNYKESGYSCDLMCSSLGGTVENTSSCICKVPAVLKDKYSESEPQVAFNGQVTVYEIDISPCSTAPNHFSPVGTISVPKQTN